MPANEFQQLVNKKFLFRFFLLQRLPMAFFAGVKVKHLDDKAGITQIRYKWITQNPFRSMYFACQAMAAEMSTGLLVLNHVYKSDPPISMLIVRNSSAFMKKATGTIFFECKEGEKLSLVIAETKSSGEGVTLDLHSRGTDEKGEIVSEFVFTWSLKSKQASKR